jgi:glyoxylase-like metal-dependent hydrolase (beta-lactamase superfamily II)
MNKITPAAVAAAIFAVAASAFAQQPAPQQPAAPVVPAPAAPAAPSLAPAPAPTLAPAQTQTPAPAPAPAQAPAPAAQAPAPAPAAPPARDFSKTVIKATNLGRDTYMLEGEGGNITLAVGKDAAIMVDAQFPPLHDRIRAAIAKITNVPVQFVINTHFHADHSSGNALFHKDGATIVAQENVKTRLAAGTTNGLTGAKTPPVAVDGLPTQTYKDRLTLRIAGRGPVLLGHPRNAHTDGDTYVLFRDANVLSTGDIFTNGRYPNIDFANGGNINGMIAGARTYLALANNSTKIVPGHGALATRADLKAYLAMLVTARDRMAKLVKEGKSEADVVAAKPFADLDAKWTPTPQASTNFIRVVYHSLADKPMAGRKVGSAAH